MKFSKHTTSILKNFATINSGIYLKQGNFIMTKSVNSATYAESTLPADDIIDFDVAIFDLNGFLSILALSGEDSEILANKSGGILIKGKRTEIIWPEADPMSIVYPKKAINFPEAKVQFDLSGDDYNQLMRISRGLGADTLSIANKSDKVVINAYNKKVDSTLSKPLSTFEVSDYEDDKDFNFIIDITNMKLQSSDYTVKLWANGDLFAAKFEGELANYVLAVEADSSHNF